MKMNEQCLPCLVSQIIKVANITKAKDKEKLYKQVFRYLSTLDFSKTNPEIIGSTFCLLKKHIGNDDPYRNIRRYYNELMFNYLYEFEKKIKNADDSFHETIKYAILGNVIDFNPIHHINMDDVMEWFESIDNVNFAIDDSLHLKKDIIKAKKVLYLGDNCGEICIDKLLLKKIKEINPRADIYFGVRGFPVVNDSIEEDAYFVGINEYATIINNGDDSLGTVLSKVGHDFKDIYDQSDVIICKGSANFESLSEEEGNLYFLMMVKCDVMSQYIGVPIQSMICMKK